MISHVIHHILEESLSKNIHGIRIKGVYPLRFIKQVLSMFCSINNFEDPRIEGLRNFVLNKTELGLNKAKYKICMYFTKSHFMKYAPLSAILKMNDHTWEPMVISEITAYPLGFILYFNPKDTWKYDGIDITNFSDYSYEDKVDIEIPLCVKEMNDLFPTLYRSREEIQKCVEENKKWCENNKKSKMGLD